MKTSFRTIAMASTALGASLISAGTAMAQVDTITVTAQRREQTLQETPVAVSAVPEEQLQLGQIRDVRDLQQLVPSLRVAQFSRSGVTEFAIRGLGTSADNVGLEPSVAIFVDNVYRSRQGAAINDFLSLERVEVLRGPQSTLFGKNSPAGVVHFITQAPEYEFGAVGEVTLSNYNGRIFRGTVTGPVMDGNAAVRFDFNRNTRDGFLDNVATGGTLNNRDRWSFRGQFAADLGENVSVRLIGDLGTVDENCCAAPFSFNLPQNAGALAFLGATVLPADPYARQIATNSPVITQIDTRGLSGQVDIDFDGFQLTSITAYRHFRDDNEIDADFTDLDLSRTRALDTRYDTFTQEFRLTSTGDNMVDWLAGVYFFDQDMSHQDITRYGTDLRPFADLVSGGAITALEGGLGFPAGTFLAAGQGRQEDYSLTTESWSVFGQLDWHVTDRFTITGGLRYTEEDKTIDADLDVNDPFSALDMVQIGFQQIFATVFFQLTGLPATPGNIAANPAAAAQAQAIAAAGSTDPNVNPLLGLTPLQFSPPAPDYASARSEDNTSGNIILSYDVSDNVNIYASYSNGYKAGGFNVSSTAAVANALEFDPEISTNYEIGLKTTLFDNTMRLDIAAFHQTLEDFQSNNFNGTAFVLDNAGEVLVRGVEIETMWRPNESFMFTGGVTHLFNAEYETYTNAPCDDLNTSGPCLINGTQDLSGRELAGAAETTATATGTWFFPLGSNWGGFVRGEVFYSSERNLGGDLDPRKLQEAITLFNGSFGFGAEDESWGLQFWGRNLNDEEYLVGEFSSVGQPGSLNGYPGDPRTYGVTLRLRR
ncbi:MULTISPECIES: TonB-dependent receptor [Hyphobacterium]|uniref:TonB-dependent receptor n=1 Tax=Hyphobacterium vulgare TaxID=1736751 RepID=A0ABV6ZTQ1_9PROT